MELNLSPRSKIDFLEGQLLELLEIVILKKKKKR
jgi:hypothetical protein